MKKYTNEEEIRLTAYYMWEESGRPWGQENEFWQKACDKLMASKSSCKTTKCASKKSTTAKIAVKTTAAKPATKTACKAKTNLKVSATHSAVKANAAINNAYGFKSNISSLKSKVSLNSNKTLNTKNNKKSLI